MAQRRLGLARISIASVFQIATPAKSSKDYKEKEREFGFVLKEGGALTLDS